MMKLLLVEDDDRVARGIHRLVLAMGHEVIHTRSVALACEALTRGDIDVVLADVQLGGDESGAEVLHHARHSRPGALRVLTSGAPPPESVLADPPYHWFLRKPFGRAELQELLRGGVPPT
jgi:DNA-binding response OmpR family regulator